MDFHGIDLNLLVAFDALMNERNVTRAAARVGVSQPAMSAALSRLRLLLADPCSCAAPAGCCRPSVRGISPNPCPRRWRRSRPRW
ncbi:LysR family transcriptional regulator [Xylophilus rhododendri]|uniref:LysR family transcriptional regulator n=1 Tax=Xylophilus rhododendri TaxID=2697032 RepID=UPI002DD98F0F|nr:LysR family transcriptional regulator [Xylophilus rhododendri]